MKVFVAGATGVLGHRLVADLVERDHDVVGLARDDAGAATVREAGGEPVRGDLLEPDTIERAVPESVDAVVHAATAIPTGTKTTKADWETTDRLRREGTETLTAAAAEAGADRYLQQSIVWLARQDDGSTIDEDSEPNTDAITQSALDGEEIATNAGEEYGFDVVALRGGWFYAPDAAHTRGIGENLLDRRMPIIGRGLLGRGDAELSLLHVDDAASAYVAAIEGDAAGVYNVVDDRPVTLAAFLRCFAAALNAPNPLRIPGWLARLAVGKHTVSMLTNPFPATNERFRRDFDWEPQHPTYKEGIQQVVERWREEGTIAASEDGEIEWVGHSADAASPEVDPADPGPDGEAA